MGVLILSSMTLYDGPETCFLPFVGDPPNLSTITSSFRDTLPKQFSCSFAWSRHLCYWSLIILNLE